MPKATAVWLIENTQLTFDQIADFCGLHPLEVQGIADGDVANGVIGMDPVLKGITSRESIAIAEKNPDAKVEFVSDYKDYISVEKKRKKSKYTPVARRQDKPDAIAWLVKTHPELTDMQISKLIGTTKKTIEDIRNRTHWNMANLKPRDPVLLGICTQTALEAAIFNAKSKAGNENLEANTKQEKKVAG
ncbi:MAG: cell cycle transcriptional regulator TrcR [Rickettsiales bacterium]|nr:cell cycle transcriptional regulator TrcR [Rickettsiales bacterium]